MRAGITSLTVLSLLALNSACDTTLEERNHIRAAVLTELENAGYAQANPNAVAGYVNGATHDDPMHRPSKDFGFAMNMSSSIASAQDGFYQMYSEKDVILWIGCSPPRGAWYFGCTEYLDSFAQTSDKGVHPGSSDVPPAGMLLGPFASMGDSMNQLNLRSTDPNFWDSTFVMITTPDETAAGAVMAALGKHAPKLQNAINIQVVPSLLSSRINLGSGKNHSVFTTGCRLAPGNLDEWAPEIRGTVKRHMEHQEPLLYLEGTDRSLVAKPYETPLLKPRGGGGATEQSLEESFKAMICQVKQQAFDMGFVQSATSGETTLTPAIAKFRDFYLNGTQCITDGGNCLQDTQDALYTTASVPLTAASMQVAVGVNHRMSGKATYGYITVGKLNGFSVHDRQSEGSSLPWAPPLANPNLFIALTIRSTQGECNEMPEDFRKSCYNISSSQVFYNEKAYLDPSTKTGPDASELLPSKVLRFEKRAAVGSNRPICEGVDMLV